VEISAGQTKTKSKQKKQTMKTHTLLALVGLATGFVIPAFSQTTPKSARTLLVLDSSRRDLDGANGRLPTDNLATLENNSDV
jgi:hypothetical protein